MVTLDLSGEICPYTLVKSKLALETILPGETLRVLLDHAPAARDVPRAFRESGHEVLAVDEPAPGRWEIVVRKRL